MAVHAAPVIEHEYTLVFKPLAVITCKITHLQIADTKQVARVETLVTLLCNYQPCDTTFLLGDTTLVPAVIPPTNRSWCSRVTVAPAEATTA